MTTITISPLYVAKLLQVVEQSVKENSPYEPAGFALLRYRKGLYLSALSNCFGIYICIKQYDVEESKPWIKGLILSKDYRSLMRAAAKVKHDFYLNTEDYSLRSKNMSFGTFVASEKQDLSLPHLVLLNNTKEQYAGEKLEKFGLPAVKLDMIKVIMDDALTRAMLSKVEQDRAAYVMLGSPNKPYAVRYIVCPAMPEYLALYAPVVDNTYSEGQAYLDAYFDGVGEEDAQ